MKHRLHRPPWYFWAWQALWPWVVFALLLLAALACSPNAKV